MVRNHACVINRILSVEGMDVGICLHSSLTRYGEGQYGIEIATFSFLNNNVCQSYIRMLLG